MGVLDMSRVYPKTLFGPMFYSWWNCPLNVSQSLINQSHVNKMKCCLDKLSRRVP